MLRNSYQALAKSSNYCKPHKSLLFQPKILFITIRKPVISTLFKPTRPSNKRFFSSILEKSLNKLRYPLYFYLIGANVAIFLAWNTGIISKKFLFDNFTLSKYTIAKHHYHTILTHAFSHISSWHLAFNMITLYFFGKFIELNFGSKVLFQVYMLGAFVGGLFITSQNNQKKYVVSHLGASGATTAILSFFIMNFPNYTIFLYFIPVPAWLVGGLIFAQSIMFYESDSGISYSGHLGGFIAGMGMYFHLRGRLF